MSEFYQKAPRLENQYTVDNWLRIFLSWRLPRDAFTQIESELKELGELVVGPMLQDALQAEREPPTHTPFDAWGNRIDEIRTSTAWKNMERVAAEWGIVATAYERKLGEYSRLHQFAKLYLYHPSSALYSCPLAMTDGAARIIELLGPDHLKKNVLPRLLSRNPESFWTSGQWMTEKTGGSDVSDTSTLAKKEGDKFRLFGTKWFTSAISANVALALARVEGATAGSRGLSLFFVEVRNAKNEFKNVRVLRLKDKLGTRALPTAEIEIEGAYGELLGEPGHGVRNIATMLNITRLYNSVCAAAQMRRSLAWLEDYANKRVVFGQPLMEQAAFKNTYFEQKALWVGSLVLTLYAGELLGKDECQKISDVEQVILRLLTPVVKLTTGKWAVSVVSEALEGFAGVGYMEDSGLPVLLRDAQVFPIWEGPTNVLALDVLRVLQKEGTLETYCGFLRGRVEALQDSELRNLREIYLKDLKGFEQFCGARAFSDKEFWSARARSLGFNLARLTIQSLLLEMASWSINEKSDMSTDVLQMLKWWSTSGLVQWPVVATEL